MADFFIADLHFGAQTIIRYENRPFSDAEEMERRLIENWNNAVGADDAVYVLGDFSAYADPERDREILSQLAGTKILIMGNHSWPILYREFFLLSHEPLYINQNMPYANFYGHVHNNASYRDVSPQSVCLSVERTDYRPLEFFEIRNRMKAADQNL